MVGRAQCQAVREVKPLQVAGIFSGACFNVLEYGRFGCYDERHIPGLWNRIYRRKGNLFSCGRPFSASGLDQVLVAARPMVVQEGLSLWNSSCVEALNSVSGAGPLIRKMEEETPRLCILNTGLTYPGAVAVEVALGYASFGRSQA